MAESDERISLLEDSYLIEDGESQVQAEECSDDFPEEGLESVAGCECKSQCTRKLKTSKNGKVTGCPCKGYGLKCGFNCTCGTRSKPCKNKSENMESELLHAPSHALSSTEPTVEEMLEALSYEKLLKVAKVGFSARRLQLQDIISDMESEPTEQQQVASITRSVPSFCICGNCREMHTEKERICCKEKRLCRSKTSIFHNICIESDNLSTAIRSLADTYVFTATYKNRAMRHASYRQYVMWQHGYLGKGHRRVIPSCCVWEIRKYYPSPDGSYTGYKD